MDPFQLIYGETETMDASILTCMRYHALEAFPSCIVSIRDADTVFPVEMQVLKEEVFLLELYEWERIFHETAQELPEKSMILGTSVTYRNAWHVNSRPKNNQLMYAPFGLFAGFATFLLNRPTDIWDLLWAYLISRYSVKEGGMTWNYGRTVNGQQIAFGKDERFFFFGVLTEKPEYLPYIFFFELNYRAMLSIPKRIQLPLKIYNNEDISMEELRKAYQFAIAQHGRRSMAGYAIDTDMFYTKAFQEQAILDAFKSDAIFQEAMPPYIELHNKWLHDRLTEENMYSFEKYSLFGGTHRMRLRRKQTYGRRKGIKK